ncbi:MAG: class I SAM-dependent methyltransferase [Anaerolineae bacterium]
MTDKQHDPTTETVACNYCGSTDTQVKYPDTRGRRDKIDWSAFRCTHPGYGVHPPIVECQNCGLIYTNPRPRQDVIIDSYEAVEDPTFLEERAGRELTFQHHLRSFEKFTGPADGRRLLDVGAYIGVFVEQAQASGWDAWGVEPSVWGAAVAQEQGLNVIQGGLGSGDLPFDAGSFHALTMWDVIEHVADPMQVLCDSYDLLKPGGWIAVHTMDANSLFAKIMGNRWPWLMEMHIYYFTRETLRLMMERVGFRVERIKPQGRYLRLQYLTTRLRPYSPPIANAVDTISKAVGLNRLALPINFGDLVTAFAQKPH